MASSSKTRLAQPLGIDQLTSNPTDLKLVDLMVWSLPICDIPAIIGPDKHLNGPGDETGDDVSCPPLPTGQNSPLTYP